MLINDRLSTILTQHAGEMAFVQRSQCIELPNLYDFCSETLYKPAMKILLSNDDGYEAQGLLTLFEAVSAMADVIVVAPETDCSGSSSSLSLRQSIRVRSHKNGYVVRGTPADCVHLAITGMLDYQPDMVISGINHGANLGDDVLYSGTVAAAIEGRFLRLPAMAVSMAGVLPLHFDTAARVVVNLLGKMESLPLSGAGLLNLNVPDVPYEQIDGMAVTRLGQRNQSEPIIAENPRNGDNRYQIGQQGVGYDVGVGTDFYAINQGKVSVTPLTIDMTHHKRMPAIADWLNGNPRGHQ